MEGHCHFEIYGNGPEWVLAFHGFGQDRRVFEAWATAHPSFRVMAFDLFFHGASVWHGNSPYLKITTFTEWLQHELKANQIEQFAVLGFSIGAKVALSIAGLFPSRVHRMILIAPDGLALHPWYRFLTATWLGKKLFATYTKKGGQWLGAVRRLTRWGWIPAWQSRLLEQHLTDAKRWQVYHTWLLYRDFGASAELPKQITDYQINIRILLSDRDPIFPPQKLKKTLSEFATATVKIVGVGHFQLLRWALQHEHDFLMGDDGRDASKATPPHQ